MDKKKPTPAKSGKSSGAATTKSKSAKKVNKQKIIKSEGGQKDNS